MTTATAPAKCARCGGKIIRSDDGEPSCINCGRSPEPPRAGLSGCCIDCGARLGEWSRGAYCTRHARRNERINHRPISPSEFMEDTPCTPNQQ